MYHVCCQGGGWQIEEIGARAMNGGTGGVDRAVPWPTGPDLLCQLFVCLFPWLASSRPGEASEAWDLLWLPACSRWWYPHQGVEMKKLGSGEGSECVCRLLALPCRVPLLSETLGK